MGIAHKNGIEFKLPDWPYAKYFANYKADLTPDETTKAANTWQAIVEPTFHYNEITLDAGRDGTLQGYFQCERYFEDVKEQVSKLFTFSDELENAQREKIVSISSKLNRATTSIGLHVRRGDYTGHPSYYNAPLSYYAKAMRYMEAQKGECIFYIFSDDIAWCKTAFKDLPGIKVFIEGGSDIEDLCFMSLMDNLIIANSSFSWWAAWLCEHRAGVARKNPLLWRGQGEDSEVIWPGKWLIGEFQKKNNDKDIVPARWHAGAPDSPKIDLKDVTFTIPVMYDHDDRKANVDACLHFLQKHFETNIIIGEWAKDKKFNYTAEYCKYFHFDFEGPFHRTMMLNQMAMKAETPYIFNYDADVFFEPSQILECIEQLRKSKAHGCYPYDGRFYRVERNCIDAFKQTFEPSEFALLPYPDEQHKDVSYGGAIAWNKNAFIKIGMENEAMISFGPEDYERYERAKRLGYKIARVNGPLYHINHFTGYDSTKNNPHFKANWAEYEKVKNLPEDRFKEYVEGWPWRIEAVKTLPAGDGGKEQYDPTFFAEINEGAMRTADIVIPILRSMVPFKTVLDIGCGQGAWGMQFEPANYTGIDGDYVKPEHLLVDKSQFIAKDLSKKFNLRKKFDLVISLEVAEHLLPQDADTFIDNLCRHSDLILFSAAIPGQGGNGHLNEQWQSWWELKFAERNYHCYDLIRPPIWARHDIPYYYRQNTLVYSKKIIEQPVHSLIDVITWDKFHEVIKYKK